MTFGGFTAEGQVIYLPTTPDYRPPTMPSSPTSPAPARWRLLALCAACALALAACKGGNGDADAKDGGASKQKVDAVPVEVAKVGRRAIAASYSGTAPLEAR